MNKIVFNCGLIGYAVNLVIHITINKIVFKLWFDSVYYLSVHYQIHIFISFRQNDRDKSPIMHD